MKALRQNSTILRRAALSSTGQSSIAGGGGKAGGVVIKRLTKLCSWEFTQLQRLHVVIYSLINQVLHSYT
jgi:hypothetical protein